ncbi:protein NLRC3-like [Pelmatolapia mariae]|uniref:protein NLRC3-like n=1 Tax=Pelmatolapia mariae TaxID=158779 RepID=UPI003211F6DD
MEKPSPVQLLEMLKNLGEEELKLFHFYLQYEPGADFPKIHKCQLENADRLKTVEVMVQVYSDRVMEVAKLILGRLTGAANQIPPQCVGRVTEIRGFTDPQKEEYFRKRFRDEEQSAVNKALQSPNGHLDLFLRFLLGLSLQNNQILLRGLLTQTERRSQTNQETIQYIKARLHENLSAEKSINLLHCLNELNDHSLVEEIQQGRSSGSLSTGKLSPAQCSALTFILLSSEDLDEFDFKKYSASEEALLRMLPVVKTSKKALLSNCNLSEKGIEILLPVVSSQSCSLRELDLSTNSLKASAVKLLSAAVENPHTKLNILRLNGCNVSERSCEDLSSVLSSQFSSLRELDLSNCDLQDSGVKLLSARLKNSQCAVETLRKMMKDPSSAEEELFKVRSAFVWRVSTELLKQLLEALVSDGVLNELEKESILEKNPVRADKARCFIDTVKKKGDKACRIMIRHLQTVDLSLFSQLRLYSDLSAQQETLQNCRHHLQSKLKKKFQCVFEGIAKAGNPTLLNKIYTELYITEGGTAEVNDEHEVRQIETASRKPDRPETIIRQEDIFKDLPGRDEPIRTVLTKGVAGIGKTVLTQKYTLDWAEDKANQDIQFIFPFTFRELNVLKEEKFSLVELVHHFFTETKEAGICSLEDFQVVFIFDGLDECRLPLDFHKTTILTDPRKSTSVDVLLINLIRGELLPFARLWITTRPAAADQIPPKCVSMVTEIRGFTDPQKEEYFRKRFRDEEQASRIISHITTSRSLHIMCHIPVFCWITATVLEDVLETREGGQLPKTLTEMYIHFLVVQAKVKKVKYDGGAETDPHWSPESREMIESLGKLAFDQLQKGNLIFYESDLTECGIDIRAASVYSGVFTQIFKEERGLYQDKVFCFIHLSVQEFLAALHVHLTFINSGLNLLEEQQTTSTWSKLSKNQKAVVSAEYYFYQSAVEKALQSPNGHLDLFLRFLLGLSLQANQSLLRGLMTQIGSSSQINQETVVYIKKKLSHNLSAEKSINLFHCLNELNDHSLVEEIQESLRSGSLSTDELSPAQWSALVFILLSSEKDLDEFDLKKYSASEEALLRLLPVVKASNKALLSSCNLSERGCERLLSLISSQSCSLRELDLSTNSLKHSAVKLLSNAVESPHAKLNILRLSGCNLSETSCEALSSVPTSQSSNLRKLDLSNSDLQDSAVKLISAGLKRSHCTVETLRVEPAGEQWLRPGLKKYSCQLTIDANTVHTNLQLSDNNRKVTRVEAVQSYPDHPDRFDVRQLLCRNGLTGRCYWEVEWRGYVYISVSYRRIRRKGRSDDCWFGHNNQSWSLNCSYEDPHSIWHNNRQTWISSSSSSSSVSNRAAVYVDCPAGTLSFYRVSSDTLIHLHTFNTTFTETLYPGFWVGTQSSVSLC